MDERVVYLSGEFVPESQAKISICIPAVERDLQVYDALNADEAFLTSTSMCLVHVSRINGVAIGDGKPGPLTARLTEAWSKMVGVDIVQQYVSHL